MPPVDRGVSATALVRGSGWDSWLSDSERDDQFVVDFDEFDDLSTNCASDQVLVCRRTGVSVVGGLVGEVLDEQQVVRLGRVPIHAERQGSASPPGPFGANSCTIASISACMPSLSLIGNTFTSTVISFSRFDAVRAGHDLTRAQR